MARQVGTYIKLCVVQRQVSQERSGKTIRVQRKTAQEVYLRITRYRSKRSKTNRKQTERQKEMYIKTLWRNLNVHKAITKIFNITNKSNTVGQKRSGGSGTSQSGHPSQQRTQSTAGHRSDNKVIRVSRDRRGYFVFVESGRRVGGYSGRITRHEKIV